MESNKKQDLGRPYKLVPEYESEFNKKVKEMSLSKDD